MPSAPPSNLYTVYGLTVETWIPFPELQPAPPGAAVDAVFRLGEVPAELPGCRQRGARFQAAPGRLLAWLDEVARYLAVDGREIIVQPESGAIESDLRLFLMCSPIGALLLQRGVLPLHASAIATPRGAVIFMGASGAGKSTLAASFHRRGLRVLADDISVVRFAPDGAPWVMPGLPQFKLWPDAVARLGPAAGEPARLRSQIEKRAVPFWDGFHSEPLPLEHIFFLRPSGKRTIEVDRLSGIGRVPPLLNHTYRAQFLPGLGIAASCFEAVTGLAKSVKVTRISRPVDGDQDVLADRVASEIGL